MMMLEPVLFFALASASTTTFVVLLGLRRARLWLSLPLGAVALLVAAAATAILDRDLNASIVMAAAAFAVSALVRLRLRRWSFMAAELLTTASLACAAYLAYAAYLTVWLLLHYNALWFISSLVLLVLETGALLLALTYAFEMLDVLSRRPGATAVPTLDRQPLVAVQVPTYSEPLEVVQPTLE